MRSSKSKLFLVSETPFDRARQVLINDLESGKSNINTDTQISVNELIRINQLGMLTLDSQQGLIVRGKVPVDRALEARLSNELHEKYRKQDEDIQQKLLEENYTDLGGTYEEGVKLKEKAYLVSIFPIDKSDILIDRLNQFDNIFAYKVTLAKPKVELEPIWVTYVPTTHNGKFSNSDEFPLVGITALVSSFVPFSESEYGEHVDPLPSDDRLFCNINVADTRFGHSVQLPDGLFKKVIKALSSLQ